MKRWLILMLMGLGAVSLSCSRGGAAPTDQQPASKKWHCPMHPTYISDKPGDCPICGMRLIPMEAAPDARAQVTRAEHAGPTAQTSRSDEVIYQCPMHPEVTSDKPGKCPKCGMDLRPVPKPSQVEHTGHAPDAGSDHAIVTIPAEKLQLMGVKTTVVTQQNVDRTVRTVARVDFDETRLHHVHAKFEGFIEHLYVNFTGKFVRKNDPVATIYSPELVATQNEYLIALRSSRRDGGGLGGSTLDAARSRLLQFDISEKEIQKIEELGRPIRSLTLYSPHTGVVLEKKALEGNRVTPGDSLIELADLSRVWVLADVYEKDLPFVHLRQSARVTSSGLPGAAWEGMVTYIYPTVEEKTRTIKVRIDLDNRKAQLKPGMFVDVTLRAGGAVRRLAVPDSAVIQTGTRAIVFLAREAGRFEPRTVETGERTADFVEIRRGLEPGDRVVVGANFLLDSESRLKAAIDAMAGSGAAGSPAGGHRH